MHWFNKFFDPAMGPEYEQARIMAEENAYERMDEHNPVMLIRLRQAIEAGADPDVFARRYRMEAGPHRSDISKDVANAGRYIERMLSYEGDDA